MIGSYVQHSDTLVNFCKNSVAELIYTYPRDYTAIKSKRYARRKNLTNSDRMRAR